MEKVLVIIGPTAVGKTSLSIDIAKQYNGEIINGDSVQIYKRLDIGSAKITIEEMQGVIHHLLDIKEPDEVFSVADFQYLVRGKINEITSRGKLPIICGGTGLYIQAVLYDFTFLNEGRDEAFALQFQHLNNEELHLLLGGFDKEAAIAIHPNNRKRVLRALEIYHSNQQTKSNLIESQTHQLLYDSLIIGLDMDREILYDRINRRVDIMLNQGLEKEVFGLYNDHYRVNAIGYKEFYPYFESKITIDEVLEEIKKNTRHYAKRQLTYFRNKLPVSWFNVMDTDCREKIKQRIHEWLQK